MDVDAFHRRAERHVCASSVACSSTRSKVDTCDDVSRRDVPFAKCEGRHPAAGDRPKHSRRPAGKAPLAPARRCGEPCPTPSRRFPAASLSGATRLERVLLFDAEDMINQSFGSLLVRCLRSTTRWQSRGDWPNCVMPIACLAVRSDSSLLRPPRRRLRSLFVRPHNFHDQRMSHDVGFSQTDRGKAGDVLQSHQGVDQPASRVRRQVNLRFVSGDDDLRTGSHPRQKHLHLRNGRVLGFVENDEGLVERSTSHVGQAEPLRSRLPPSDA